MNVIQAEASDITTDSNLILAQIIRETGKPGGRCYNPNADASMKYFGQIVTTLDIEHWLIKYRAKLSLSYHTSFLV